MAAGYDWPELEGLIEFTKKYGLNEAAERLGLPPRALRNHFNHHGIAAAEFNPPKSLNADALKEIRDLLDG